MRTIQEIYDQLVSAKDNDPELNTRLTSTSSVAVWKLLFYIIAVAVWVHEGLFDAFKNEVEAKISDAFAGTIPWYHRKSLEFQYGDIIEISDNGSVGYSIVDDTKKIIKHAAIVEVGNILAVKVAKENQALLDVDEEAAFASYLKKIKFAGTKVSVVNLPADELIIDLTVWYDPMVLSATGESLLNPGQYPVNDEISNYIGNIVFGGTIVKSKVVDSAQEVLGVCDAEMTQLQARRFNTAYSIVTQNLYTSYSGKFNIDQLNINYQPCNII